MRSDERIDEGVLRWFGHVERMENDRIAKRIYVVECLGSQTVGRKRWIDTVRDCVKKRGLDFGQARTMVHDRSVCGGFVTGNARSVIRGMNP